MEYLIRILSLIATHLRRYLAVTFIFCLSCTPSSCSVSNAEPNWLSELNQFDRFIPKRSVVTVYLQNPKEAIDFVSQKSGSAKSSPRLLTFVENLETLSSGEGNSSGLLGAPGIIYATPMEFGFLSVNSELIEWRDAIKRSDLLQIENFEPVNSARSESGFLNAKNKTDKLRIDEYTSGPVHLRFRKRGVGRDVEHRSAKSNRVAVESERLADHNIFVEINPKAILHRWGKTGRIGEETKATSAHFVAQIKSVFATLNLEPKQNQINGELTVTQSSGAPKVIEHFEHLSSSPPPIGPLASKKNTPAIIRVSSKPEQLMTFTKNLLPPLKRRDIRNAMRQMVSTLKLDIQTDILENVYGHFLLAIHGFHNTRTPTLSSLLDPTKTAKTLLIPIREHKSIERALNIGTQITKGRLRRQSESNHTQYAWVTEGEMRFAVLLTDNFVLIGDSPLGLDRAISYFERRQTWSPDQNSPEQNGESSSWAHLRRAKDTFSGYLNVQQLPVGGVKDFGISEARFRSHIENNTGITEISIDFSKSQDASSASR